MKVFPEWMYRDPALAIERLESIGLRAQARARVRELDRERDLKQLSDRAIERAAYEVRRVIFSPPEIRLKQLRIRQLVRKAMKGN